MVRIANDTRAAFVDEAQRMRDALLLENKGRKNLLAERLRKRQQAKVAMASLSPKSPEYRVAETTLQLDDASLASEVVDGLVEAEPPAAPTGKGGLQQLSNDLLFELD